MYVSQYFKVVSVADHVIHLEHQGFWSDQVAERIGDAIVARFRKAAVQASREGPFIVLADLREMGVLSQKGRVALSRVMRCAKEHGMYKAVEVIPNAITRLSLREAAELTGKNDFRVLVNTLDEALAMVDSLKQEMLAAPAKVSAR